MNDGGVAKTDVHSRCTGHTLERPVKCIQTVLPRFLRTRLHVGFVDLHHVSTRRK